jgi:hypothetical protein
MVQTWQPSQAALRLLLTCTMWCAAAQSGAPTLAARLARGPARPSQTLFCSLEQHVTGGVRPRPPAEAGQAPQGDSADPSQEHSTLGCGLDPGGVVVCVMVRSRLPAWPTGGASTQRAHAPPMLGGALACQAAVVMRSCCAAPPRTSSAAWLLLVAYAGGRPAVG